MSHGDCGFRFAMLACVVAAFVLHRREWKLAYLLIGANCSVAVVAGVRLVAFACDVS